mgnify:CR=1 FL=1
MQYVDNESMLEIYRRFMYRIFWLTVTSFSQKGRMDETINEHISLLNMIQAQDLTALENSIMHHLDVPQKITIKFNSITSTKVFIFHLLYKRCF